MTSVEQGQATLDKLIAEAEIESLLWPTLLQTLLTGIYSAIFFQTICPILAHRQQKVYATVLTLIFVTINLNLGVYWKSIREVMIGSDGDLGTMADGAFSMTLGATSVLAGLTTKTTIFLADMILVWRCYTIWAQNKVLFIVFVPLLMGEASIVVLLCMSALPFERAPGVGILTFYSISLTVTALATGLIFLRVVSVVKQSEGRVGSYALTMEVVVESGVLYTVALVVTAVFLMEGCCFASEDNMALPITASFWTQALPAVTGIAPTLITFRVATGRARDDAAWSRSKPLSSLQFKKTHPDTTHSDNVLTNSTPSDLSYHYKSQHHGDLITEPVRGSLRIS